MKKTARFIVLSFISFTILFLYQNCGTKGEIFGNCETDACGPSGSAAVFIRSDDYANYDQMTVGKVASLETGSPGDFKNIDIAGDCNQGLFRRHAIRWSVECTTGCTTLNPRSGVTMCYSNRFTIRDYVRGMQVGAGIYSLKIQIVGLDDFDNDVSGGADSQLYLPMLVQNVANPPLIKSFSSNETDEWRNELTVLKTMPIYVRGYCDRQSTDAENNLTFKAVKAGTNDTVISISGVTCNAITAGSTIAQHAPSGYTGYFDREVTIGTLNAADIDTCTSEECQASNLKKITRRNLDFIVTQRDLVGAQTIPISGKKSVTLKPDDLYLGKSWSVEIIEEVARRLKKSFSVVQLEQVILSSVDYGPTTLSSPPWSLLDIFANTAPTGAPGVDQIPETASIRRWIFFRPSVGLFENAQNNNTADIKFQITQGSTSYGRFLLKVANAQECGLTTTARIDGLTNQNQELQRIALCLTKRFYEGMHKSPSVEVDKLVTGGLTYSVGWENSSCNFRSDSTVAPKKFCYLAAQLLERRNVNAQARAATDLPIDPSQYTGGSMNASLGMIYTKFIGSGSVNADGIDTFSARQKFFTSAVIQLYINALMSEVSRHVVTGNNPQSAFMDSVLTDIYSGVLQPNCSSNPNCVWNNPNARSDLFRSLYPRELNHTPGPANFSAYSDDASVDPGSAVKKTGSMDCIPNYTTNKCE